MAGKTATRTSERIGRKQAVEQSKRINTGILSPNGELRKRLLETAIDVKENIPVRRGSSSTDSSGSRKRRSTKEGPAAKRPSTEKVREESGDEPTGYVAGTILSSSRPPQPSRDVSDDQPMSSVTTRSRGYALPVMVEEEEVFVETEEIVESSEEARHSDFVEEVEDEEEEEEEEEDGESSEYEDESETEEEQDLHLQNESFAFTKSLLNRPYHLPAPPLLTAAKCEGIGSPAKVWSLMVKQDEIPRATRNLLQYHPDMTAGMRRLLVDWMMEVCESEKLHRETFHLAVDYVDRYLETTEDECNNDTFQLVGTAALFIAAKYEEIYPPKCVDFAQLTDNAFNSDHIRHMEALMAKCIGWRFGPVTSIHWLSTYLQLLGTGETNELDGHAEESNMYVPELLRNEFMEMCKVLDYLLLDVNSFSFSYRIIAAAVLFVSYEPSSAVERATGFKREQLMSVIQYVQPVCHVFAGLRRDGEEMPARDQIKADDTHNIQVHFNYKEIDALVDAERSRLRC